MATGSLVSTMAIVILTYGVICEYLIVSLIVS